MKKFLAITTSLCAAVCALGFGGAAAFAETDGADNSSNAGYYPTTFEKVPQFTDLKDYAVGDGEYLFLEDNVMYQYGNKRVVTYENSGKPINYLYFEDGEFYYETIYNNVYALKNINKPENPEIEDFTSTTETEDILLSNKHNYFLSGDKYYFLDKSLAELPAPVALDGFSNLKRYGETVYAVKENVLYELDGTVPKAVTVENFELTEEIKAGGVYTKLTSSVEAEPKFVTLTGGAYMTEVYLDKLTDKSSCFITGDTVTVNVAETPSALLLYFYKDGNGEGLAIISVKDKAYLIHPKNITENVVDPFTKSEYNSGTITVADCPVYSTPYEKGPCVVKLAAGTHVDILHEIKKDTCKELARDFYYIKYVNENGEDAYGYVRFGPLSPYEFNEDPPTETPDPEKTNEDLIKPVVLILIVLLLIAIAAGYLIYVGTSDKRKKKKEVAATDSTERNKQ